MVKRHSTASGMSSRKKTSWSLLDQLTARQTETPYIYLVNIQVTNGKVILDAPMGFLAKIPHNIHCKLVVWNVNCLTVITSYNCW